MSTRVRRHELPRRVPLVATATACLLLLAVNGPLASADGGDEGSLGADKSNVQTPKTGPVGNIASTVKDTLRDIASSFDGHRSTVHRARTTSGSQRIQNPGPGINFGNAGTGNTNFGTNTDPAGANIWNIGNDNDNVATNSGPGVNLVSAGDDNQDVGEQSVAPNNFGINAVSVGDNNVGAPGDSNSGFGTNTVTGNNSVGYNLAVLGDNTTLLGLFGSAINVVKGDGSFGSNVIFAGNGTSGNGGNEVEGNNSSAINFALVGDNAVNSVDNGIFGNNSSVINVALIGRNTNNVANTIRQGNNLFGSNLAIVGEGSKDSANNLDGSMNFAFIGANSLNSGNNKGGGLNIAFVPPNSTDVGNCSSSVCVNLFGVQLMGS